MDPISASLLSISSTGYAVRKLAKAIEAAQARDHAALAPSRLDGQPSDLLRSLTALKGASLRVRRLIPEGAEALAADVARFAARHGLTVSYQVGLAAVVEAETDAARAALAERRVDLLLSTPEGAPVAGIDIVDRAGPCHRDRVRQRAFAGAGLPLVRAAPSEPWAAVEARLHDLAEDAPADAPEPAPEATAA